MKQDRRFMKTENQIVTAFVILLNEKGFDQLTVRDIADRADINRATFYQHHTDKYELLDACEKKLFREANRLISPLLQADIRATYHVGQPFPGLKELLAYYRDNRQMLLGLLNAGKTAFWGKLQQSVQEHLQFILDRQFDSQSLLFPMHYISVYIFSAHFNIMLEWLKKGAVEPTEEIAALITRLTLYGIVRGLDLDRGG